MAGKVRKTAEWQGGDVVEAVLESEAGVRLNVMNYGGVIRDWQVPVGGQMRSVVLGFDRFEDYPAHSPYFGALAGRVANRIGGSRFTLDGKEYELTPNEGPNHLHGGPGGISRKLWKLEPLEANALRLSLSSPDGDMGYPGSLDMEVIYRLDGYRLHIDFAAVASAPTPVNLVQHNYFNLMGGGEVFDHRLEVAASAYTVTDDALIPTGEIKPVAGTRFDFRHGHPMRDESGAPIILDQNLVLDTRRDPADPVASLVAPDGSLRLELFTDQPGLQVYNGGQMDIKAEGLGGRRYPRFGGMCLEDQHFPDAVNNPHFPNTIVAPEAPYRHRCAIEIRP
ncbi:aldose epimerase family protein [Nitratireductor thuwali]|uniref:Aldose 1-epimerase n=1 Tax=Nitratireductor thuwali TaxID=2267699 RepID=A0ABY5MKR8_9HYPH|nr:Aldose 1-epimerase [Nitratireductor thuwali]